MADPIGYFNVGAGTATATLAASPTWTRLDNSETRFALQNIVVDRGRSYEFDKTATGTARVTFTDVSGDLDFTNTSSGYAPGGATEIDVMKQAVVCLPNPAGATVTWHPVFRGFISSMSVEPHPTEKYLTVTYDLVDALNIFARTEMVPSTTSTPIFGATVPAGTEGDVYYAEDTATDAVQTRIGQVLDEVGWPSALREIFSGNSKLQEVTYPYRTSALAVIQDAADAEFPGVANFYVNSGGTVCFHGRYSRFDPETTSTATTWDFTDWYVGDLAAATASPATVVPLSPPIRIVRDEENLYTNAICTPQGITDSGVAAQYVKDTTAVSKYGLRTWSAENLLNLGGQIASGGAGTFVATQTTKAMAQYYVDNFAVPRTRLGQLTVRSQPPEGVYGDATWALIVGADIGDRVTVATTHYGGGGATGTFFVEGVHYDVVPGGLLPGGAPLPDVTMTVDVSPTSYYDTPFA